MSIFSYRKKVLLIFAFLFFGQGCVMISHQKYPESNKFLAKEMGASCVDMEGVYNNSNFEVEDKRIFKNTSTISLASHLIPAVAPNQKVDKVKINQHDPNVLEILALEGEDVVASQKYDLEKKDYQCKDGRIIFKYHYPDMAGIMGQPLHNSNHLELSRTIHSDLALRESTVFYNILVIPPLPLFLNGSELYFFRKIE